MSEKDKKKAFKEALKGEVNPLLIGLRNEVKKVKEAVEKAAEKTSKTIVEVNVEQIAKTTEETILKTIADSKFRGEQGEPGKSIEGQPGKQGKSIRGKRGLRGLAGKSAKTPKKGVDYFTRNEIDEFLKVVTPVKGKDYFDGKAGDSVSMDALDIRNKLESLTGKQRLSISAIKDLEERLSNMSGGGIGSGADAVGVLSIIAGTNITVDNTDPAHPIISSTGGGGDSLWQETDEGATLQTIADYNKVELGFAHFNNLFDEANLVAGNAEAGIWLTPDDSVTEWFGIQSGQVWGSAASYTFGLGDESGQTIYFQTDSAGYPYISANRTIDLNQIRITGLNEPTTGAGIEMYYSGSLGSIQTFDRDASEWKDFQFAAKNIAFSAFGGATEIRSNGSPIATFNFDGSTDVHNNPIHNVADAVDPQDAVNLQTLEDMLPTPPFSSTFDATTDWGSAVGGFYSIVFTHDLNSLNLVVELWDETGTPIQTFVDKVEQTDLNTMTISVPEIPDGRFAGRIVIINGGGSSGGSDIPAQRTITADSTLLLTDGVIWIDASGGNIIFTLLPIATATGKPYRIHRLDSSANTVTIQGDGSETINGQNSRTLAPNSSVELIANPLVEWGVF